MEDDFEYDPKQDEIGYYIYLGQQLIDVLVITQGDAKPECRIPLSTDLSSDMVRVIAK